MEDFDKVLALRDAAQDCNYSARRFIDDYKDLPHLSTYGPNRVLDSFAALLQAKQHLDRSDSDIAIIERDIQRWDDARDALYWVEVDSHKLKLPIFTVAGKTKTTSHQAARDLAELVVDRWRNIEGLDDIELCHDLARSMSELAETLAKEQDFTGFIGRESAAAQDACPLPPEETDAKQRKARRMSKDEANELAKPILKRNPRIKVRDLAAEIGCSSGTAFKLPARIAVQGELRKGRKPKEVKEDWAIPAADTKGRVSGHSMIDQKAEQAALDALIDEQEAELKREENQRRKRKQPVAE